MKTKSTFIIYVIAGMFIFQSCSVPQNIVKLQPENKEGRWLYGQQFVADSINGVIYEVGFDQLQGNRYLFDFTVINRSNMPILIDPANFFYQASDHFQKPLSEKIMAVNPENEIMKIEKSLAKREARETNHIGLSLLAAGVDVASGIAVITDDNPHNNHIHTHFYRDVQLSREENAFEAENLKNVRDAWKNSTLRKTTLEPHFKIEGKVFFPASGNVDCIKLFLPVDNNFVEFNFIQVRFPVKV